MSLTNEPGWSDWATPDYDLTDVPPADDREPEDLYDEEDPGIDHRTYGDDSESGLPVSN